MAGVSDEHLVDRSLSGDAEAFVELVRRHEQSLAALIGRELDDAHHREDVFQETLMQAWRGLAQLRDRSKAKAWLIAIARNRCRDFSKSARRRERPADGEAMQAYVNRMGRAVRRQDRDEEVSEAVSAMPPRKRRILDMFYFQGLSIAEISRRIRRSEGTVKSRLFHARRALGRRLETARINREPQP